jgi:hypothetical protein
VDRGEVDDVEAEVGDVRQALDRAGERAVHRHRRFRLAGREHRRAREQLVPGAERSDGAVDDDRERTGALLVAHPPVERRQLALVEVGLQAGGELAVDARLQRGGVIDPRLDDQLVAAQLLDDDRRRIVRSLDLVHRMVDDLPTGQCVTDVDHERHVLVAQHHRRGGDVVAGDALHRPSAALDGGPERGDGQTARPFPRDRRVNGAGGAGGRGRSLVAAAAGHYWAARTAKS